MPDMIYWPEKPLKEVHIEDAAKERCLARSYRGTLPAWKTQVAQQAAESPHASIAILASLAAALRNHGRLRVEFPRC